MPLDTVISSIATPLAITSIDVYVLFFFLIFLLVFAFLGIGKIYDTFFGLVFGIGIFTLLSTLLSPQYQNAETSRIFGETITKAVIGSSVYLVFILSILVPINGWIRVSQPKTMAAKIIQTILLAILLFLFVLSIVFGLTEKLYIFHDTNSIFTLLKLTDFYSEFQTSKIYAYTLLHLPLTIILSISFVIYKLLLSDIVTAVLLSVLASLNKPRVGGHGGHDDGGHDGHDAHDDHGHDEFEDMHGGGHDDHGHH